TSNIEACSAQMQGPQGVTAGFSGLLVTHGSVRGAVPERTQPTSGGVGVLRRGRTGCTTTGRGPELGARTGGGGRSRCGTTNAFAAGTDPGRGDRGTAPQDQGGAGRRHLHPRALTRSHSPRSVCGRDREIA